MKEESVISQPGPVRSDVRRGRSPRGRRRIQRRLEVALLSLGGIGFLPRGGASAAALVGAASYWMFRPARRVRIMLVLSAACVGQLLAPRHVTPHEADPSFIVIDELAGVWLALALVPITPTNCVSGAVIFRLLDRFKPGPIGKVDRAVGTATVMSDDLLAGAAVGLALCAGALIRDRAN